MTRHIGCRRSGNAGVYTRLSAYAEWMKEVMGNTSLPQRDGDVTAAVTTSSTVTTTTFTTTATTASTTKASISNSVRRLPVATWITYTLMILRQRL